MENVLLPADQRKIYLAGEPIDFRMSIDSLSALIKSNKETHLYDGSIYVFYNKNMDKIKCLFWDTNGFVLYYKRFDREKLKVKKGIKSLRNLNYSQLSALLYAADPEIPEDEKPLKIVKNSAF